ncbi:MAG TPA: SDR family oxidoreductase [Anaerolineales bacterium]
MTSKLILVTGANGYIAGLLIPRLLEKGYRVRALVRRPERLAGRLWLDRVEPLQGDVHEPGGLDPILAGVHTAYYLIHSMASGRGYTRIDLEAARRFAEAAQRARVEHIIYLGGLADPNARTLAPHMRSRIETGNTLRLGQVPVTEFRAGVITGPGSISFEMIRYLTECFPVLPGPNWLRNRVQPIAAANVVDYLVAALDHSEARGGIYELGGPEVMQYAQTMLRYARLRGLNRLLFTLPGVPIWLMARFVDWLTPVPYPIATPLVGGLSSDSIVQDPAARQMFPEVKPISYEEAVTTSLQALHPERIERVWVGMGHDAVNARYEGFFLDYRSVEVNAQPSKVWSVLAELGGENGWLYADWLWRLRGRIDRLLSPRRAEATAQGRTSSETPPKVGDAIDYYRVEEIEENRLIRLHSELCAPGEGWMEWRIVGSTLMQTAFFAPRGLPGFLYWYLLGPLHRLVFRGLIREIQRRGEAG